MENNNENKNEFSDFLFHLNWFKSAEQGCYSERHLGEFLVALCRFAFYNIEYEGTNKAIKQFMSMVAPLVIQQRNIKTRKNRHRTEQNRTEQNFITEQNLLRQKREEEERKRILERINKPKQPR